ncbi:hypothetical protein MKI84_02980 [Ancylobacter sp. A5.8]|uniref:tubulin-like doman-containing protein n=1 Tax=Ancylobacter gelatini TaxID=2919920 RepID=UPI001F4DF258|nr:tubulin-like doman-containing protein [Ancylobacter gelatini]MCJ8141869.1 hypothetical protein [Ancylobacter gelatini]
MNDTTNADTPNRGSELLLDVMPTVFVALGGTGMEILLRLRRRILQHNWAGRSLMSLDEFPPARFVYFDTDTAEARESGRAGATDVLGSRVAFARGGETIQKKVDTAHYIAELQNYPNIQEWLPKGELDKIDTEKGAGQIRSISRLLFFDEYSNFMNLVRTQADRVTQNVTNEAALRSLGLKTGTNLRVVVVGSSAGGTGSGAFIDVGYALRSMRAPRIDQLDLFLMLPGGYRDANKERVFANTYAALSELEFAMRGTRKPPYVTRWSDFDKPEPDVASPYKDVYLFDRQNIAGQQTGNKEDIFDMVADILFEDFGSSDFARRKRSVAVNQQRHKLGSYVPNLPEWLRGGLFYSRAYSAIGQTTLISKASIQVEEHLSRNNGAMVRAFFGMALHGQARLATTEERDTFLQERLRLRGQAFHDDYDVRARFEHAPITDYALVDHLLLRADKSLVTVTLASEIEQDVAGILARIPDHKAWESEIRKLVDLRQRDVEGRVGEGTSYGPKGAEIAAQRMRLEAALLNRGNDDGSLRAELYNILDDQERGGLEYTIDLVAKIQARLDESGTGIVTRLLEAEEAYAKRANRLHAEQLQASIDRVKQAADSSFLTGGGRKAAEKYLNQVRDDLIATLQARLRSIACREAIALLHRVSQFLGSPQGVDDKTGETLWSGLIGEFQTGRRRVRQLIAMIDGDTARLQDALSRGDGGTFFVIKDKGVELPVENTARQLEWAREAFESIGGSREIFARLENEDGRLDILGLLRSVTNKQLGDYRQRIPSVVDALRQLPIHEQQRLMELLIARAMPWIYTDFSRSFRPENEHYKMFIAVDDTKAFRAEFDEMARSRLPGQSGLTSLAYEESGVPGRIVCYCELSGLPLDAIASIRSEWRPSYLREQSRPDALPLHNHKDDLRFPDPIVPTSAELEDLRERIALFLEGVMLGALRFNSTRRIYEIEVARSHWDPVGDEKYLRRRGFQAGQKTRLAEHIRRAKERFGYVQFLAMSALAGWFAKRVYTERPFEESERGALIRRGGIGHHTCLQMEKDFRLQAERIGGSLPGGRSAEDVVNLLHDEVAQWTTNISGTLDDVEDTEVGRDPRDPPGRQATEKRTINWAVFDEARLLQFVGGNAAPQNVGTTPSSFPASAASPPSPPPAPPAARYWLFNAASQVVGPFELSAFQMLGQLGQLNAEMKVCPDGSQQWVSIRDVPALSLLLQAAPAAPPAPPPVA